jgi:hypothetical protein
MTVEQRRKTLDRIARLRDAEDRSGDAGVGEVREELEADLGGTVSRNLAADFVGVSHTALNRWIDSGDVAVVLTPTGRREVPIPTVCGLRQSVMREKESGRRRLHALAPAMAESRRRAERLRLDASVLAELELEPVDRHRLADLRGLAYHQAVAPHLNRATVGRARIKVDRWEKEGRIDPRHAADWREVLGLPLKEIRAAISADAERGHDLRQNSPLAGLLSEPERRKILELVKSGAQT